jgi:hypothetical protein
MPCGVEEFTGTTEGVVAMTTSMLSATMREAVAEARELLREGPNDLSWMRVREILFDVCMQAREPFAALPVQLIALRQEALERETTEPKRPFMTNVVIRAFDQALNQN